MMLAVLLDRLVKLLLGCTCHAILQKGIGAIFFISDARGYSQPRGVVDYLSLRHTIVYKGIA
jgi:hypothetical protein